MCLSHDVGIMIALILSFNRVCRACCYTAHSCFCLVQSGFMSFEDWTKEHMISGETACVVEFKRAICGQ